MEEAGQGAASMLVTGHSSRGGARAKRLGSGWGMRGGCRARRWLSHCAWQCYSHAVFGPAAPLAERARRQLDVRRRLRPCRRPAQVEGGVFACRRRSVITTQTCVHHSMWWASRLYRVAHASYSGTRATAAPRPGTCRSLRTRQLRHADRLTGQATAVLASVLVLRKGRLQVKGTSARASGQGAYLAAAWWLGQGLSFELFGLPGRRISRNFE